ncbi:MFS transporter [Roseomonas populi]|uniref:MFS transporter n=1 Tax=Roseomonas populi TaxID=3121582 RepID=A0ABT1XA16_9PROT|nr:MFS transporter [Roseomonas pecuniae]MCR0984941.1 MFS transporter [Roseomonas pecuniae]
MTTPTIDVQNFLDESPLTRFQILVILLCFLTVAADGFDTAAIGFIAPTLRVQWQLQPAQLAPLFASGLFGLMAGALVFGPLADRVGRKWVLVLTTLGFGIASIASAKAASVESLTVWRFVTGIGLGGAMPTAITLTSEFCPSRKRSLLVTMMFCGFAIGSAVGGLAAAGIIASHGWQGVLVLGGVLPVLLSAVLAGLLSESVRYLALRGGQDERIAAILSRVRPDPALAGARFTGARKAAGSPVRQLFAPGLAVGTILLWICFFIILLIFYLLTSWLPTLLNGSGRTAQEATLISLMFPVGSTVGAVAVGALMDRLNPYAVLVGSYLLAACLIASLGAATGSPSLFVLAVFGAGVGTGGSLVGVNALAASFYPTASRATGVSWANALGRAGSIVGSLIGGTLLSMGWPLSAVFAVAAAPAVVAAASLSMMAMMARRQAPVLAMVGEQAPT